MMVKSRYSDYTKEGVDIKAKITSKGMNLATFADMHNIDRARLSDLARGKRKCLTLRKFLAKELDMPELVIEYD